jgi:hypothetical protein
MSEATLARLAESVADGDAVDWDALAQRLHGTPEAHVAARLRLVAEFAETSRPLLRGAWSAERLPLPAAAMTAIGCAQLLAAVLDFATGRESSTAVPAFRLAVAVGLGGTGAALAFLARTDLRARWLGAVLVGLAVGAAQAVSEAPALPATLAALLWVVRTPLAECFVPAFLWQFVSGFPKVVRFDPLEPVLRAGARLSLLLGAALAVAQGLGERWPEGWWGHLARGHARGSYWILLFLGSLPALAMALLRVRRAEAEERRRVRWFVAALAAGLGPLLLVVLADALIPGATAVLDRPGVTKAAAVMIYACLLSLPFTIAYAVTARRILEVRIVLRRTLRYAVARTTLAGAALVPLALMVRLLWVERARPIADILGAGQGRLLAILLGCSLLFLAAQRPLAAAVDRAFNRGRPDWSEAFGRSAALLRRTRSLEEVATSFADCVGTALGAPVSVLFRNEADLRPVGGLGGRPLALRSAVCAIVSQGPDPLLVDPEDPRSLFRWLPEEDRQWIVDTGTAMLVPLGDDGDTLAAVAGVGLPAGGEGFAAEDRRFLTALAGAAASAIESHAVRMPGRGAADSRDSARECPACGTVHPPETVACPCGRATVPAAVPHLLQGKFAVHRILGKGGMGVVYLATDVSLGREVALKTLPRVSTDALLRLRGEARSMARVAGPHLAAIHGMESWRGVPILTVEYLAGGTLANRLRTDGRMPWPAVIALGRDLAEGLYTMHRQGLLHRDVKPSNIGFTHEGVPKLLDFGLAALFHAPAETAPPPGSAETTGTATGHVMGTLLYLSPERLQGARPEPADDAWALGMVLLEAAGGTHPWRGAESALHARQPPFDAVTAEIGRLPDEARPFFAHALSPLRSQRPRSARDLALLLAASP